MSLHQNFLSVVNKAQNEKYCHKKLMKSIENSFDVSNLEAFLNVYSKALFQLYCYEYANKNPFIARGLEFLAKLAIQITLKCVTPLDVTNSNGTISQVYDITTDQFFTNLLKCSLKYASVEKAEVRFNTCYFIMLLLQNIGNNVELGYILCDSILDSLVALLDDPKVNVRLQASKALVRLQDPANPECIVLNSFLVLITDTNSEIRKAVVSLVAPHPQSFSKIRERLTDTDIGVRQAAYTKWADTNPRLYLKIVDRNFILTCGFADSNKKIKQILTEKLLPKWLNAYEGNYLDLLKALKLDADENDMKNFKVLCTEVMEVYLKMHPLSDILKYLPINKKDKLVPVRQLRIESVLYWSILISFLRKREDSEDYLESILPELTAFSNYIERVIKEKSAVSMDEWEHLEYQNIVLQLFQIASGFDISDEVGRKSFYSLILQILPIYKFQQKVIDIIVSVAAQLNHNIDSFTTDLCQVISEIREPLIDQMPSEDKLRSRNFEITQLKVKIHRLQIAEEDALKVKDFQHANIVHNELIECQRQFDNLKNIYSQCEKVRTSKDDPETLCRCLDILIGVLKIPNINTMSSALRTCKEEFLMPLLNSNISEVHWRFILCLGLFSVMDKDTAFKHANFICLPIATYRAVPNYDKNALKISVACVTDLIRVYGVKVIGIEEADSEVNQDQNQTTTRRKLYSEDMNELRAVNKDDISIEFIIDIILDMLDDEDEGVRNNAATAISRLMVHNFPVNPELITRLILKWYNPLTVRKDIKLQQQVGFIITCFTDNVEGSRKIVEKAVLPIISSLANAPRSSPLVEVDIDNVLRFLSAVTNVSNPSESVNIHNSLAVSIIEKISNKPNDVCTPHLTKLLTYLEVKSDDSIVLKNMVSSAELLLTDVMDKAPTKNILKFINKLRISMTSINEEERRNTINGAQPVSGSTVTNDVTNPSGEENAEERMSTINGAQSVNGSTVTYDVTNPSEGNVSQQAVDRDSIQLKSPSKSTSISRLSKDSHKIAEVKKRTLYLHHVDSESNEAHGNHEEKSRKGNSSESEAVMVKANDKYRAGRNRVKTRDSNRSHKELSLMKLRRKSFISSEKPLRGEKILSKIPESLRAEESSDKNINKEKIHRNESNKKNNGDDKTSSEKASDSKKDEGSAVKNRTVFVKCDYMKTVVNKEQNLYFLESSKPKLNVDISSKISKNKKNFDEIKRNVPPTTRQSSRLKKINIISHVVLGTSKTTYNLRQSNDSDKVEKKNKHKFLISTPKSYEEKKSPKEISQKNMKSSILEVSSRTSVERNCKVQLQKMSAISAKQNPQQYLHQSLYKLKNTSEMTSAQEITSSDSQENISQLNQKCNTSGTFSLPISETPKSAWSSGIVLPDHKLNGYATPSFRKKIRQKSSPGCTPLRKRVANTPLSASGNRSKRLSRRNSAGSMPSTSCDIRKTSRTSLESTPLLVNSQGRTPRDSVQKKNRLAPEISPVTKRGSDIPCSLLKKKPNKIAKIINKAEKGNKPSKVVNTISETKGNLGKEMESDRRKNDVPSTTENEPKDLVLSSRSFRHETTKGSKISFNTNRQNKLCKSLRSKRHSWTKQRPNTSISSTKKEDNHTGSHETFHKGRKELRPVLIKLSGNEGKNKKPKTIIRISGRIKAENKINQKQKHRKEEDQVESPSSEDDYNSKQLSTKKNNIKECEVQKSHSSNSKTTVNCCRTLLNSDNNPKSNNKILKNLNSVMNEMNSDSNVRCGRSKRFQKPETNGGHSINESSISRNGLKFNRKFSVEGCAETAPFTSPVTRSKMNNELNSTRNRNSSKRHLDFSSSSEETILKTFLQGDEEFQMLEDISIEDITSRSNSSGDSKKENVSINTTSTSSSFSQVRNTRRRIRTKDSSTDSGLSPKRKILKINQKRILRSAVQ